MRNGHCPPSWLHETQFRWVHQLRYGREVIYADPRCTAINLLDQSLNPTCLQRALWGSKGSRAGSCSRPWQAIGMCFGSCLTLLPPHNLMTYRPNDRVPRYKALPPARTREELSNNKRTKPVFPLAPFNAVWISHYSISRQLYFIAWLNYKQQKLWIRRVRGY